MNPSNPSPSAGDEAEIVVQAGTWIARRDRGLNGDEQDLFLQWLREEPRHRAALIKLDRTWSALDSLAQWRPDHSATPNPQLLAPGRFRRRRVLRGLLLAPALAVAAALTFMFFRASPLAEEVGVTPLPHLRVIPPAERQVLADGSVVELDYGSRFEVAFTANERRVRLLEGELYVTVTKNPLRPFIVEVDGVGVRAVGTAFAVRRSAKAVDVVVTEGRVQLEASRLSHPSNESPVMVVSGERARVDTTSRLSVPVIVPISPEEIARQLAWQTVRLEFEASPLASVVDEFNLRNRQQLLIGDASAGQVRVAGTFRADQVDVFARLLEASFGIQVDRPASGPWVLRKTEPLP